MTLRQRSVHAAPVSGRGTTRRASPALAPGAGPANGGLTCPFELAEGAYGGGMTQDPYENDRMNAWDQGGRSRLQIRPLGGLPGCLGMILFSIIASVLLTLVLNLLVR